MSVFVLAHRLDFKAERAAAVRALLRVPYDQLEDVYKELDGLSPAGPASGCCDLFIFHRQCGEAVFRYVLQHALLQSGTRSDHVLVPDAIRDAFLSDEETPWKLDVSRLSQSDNHCAGGCFAVLDVHDDPAWDVFRAKSMPGWWLRYMYHIAVDIRERPLETRLVTNVDMLQKTMNAALECSECRVLFLPRFIAYVVGLEGEIEKFHVGLEGRWDSFVERMSVF